MRFALFECETQRFLVHVGDRQHFARTCILHDGGNEPVTVELRLREDVLGWIAHRTSTPCSLR